MMYSDLRIIGQRAYKMLANRFNSRLTVRDECIFRTHVSGRWSFTRKRDMRPAANNGTWTCYAKRQWITTAVSVGYNQESIWKSVEQKPSVCCLCCNTHWLSSYISPWRNKRIDGALPIPHQRTSTAWWTSCFTNLAHFPTSRPPTLAALLFDGPPCSCPPCFSRLWRVANLGVRPLDAQSQQS